jgi:hypothetical protein
MQELSHKHRLSSPTIGSELATCRNAENGTHHPSKRSSLVRKAIDPTKLSRLISEHCVAVQIGAY